MTATMQSLFKKGASLFTPSSTPPICSAATSTDNLPVTSTEDFRTAPSHERLFQKVDPAVDGEECLHDCSSCTVRYPSRFDVDMKDKMYGNIGGWATHLLVATGKTDWVRDVADERGSLMEAIERGGVEPSNGKLKLLASNIPVPDEYHYHEPGKQPTNVLLLPSFSIIDHVTPALAPDLINHFVNPAITTTSPLKTSKSETSSDSEEADDDQQRQPDQEQEQEQQETPDIKSLTPLRSRPCPHAAVILLCSQRTRDVRCGQSAPLLRKEFERHLRPLGLYRELDDERPGGVGIYFVSHVGGHKYAANVIVYRRKNFDCYKTYDRHDCDVAQEEDEEDEEDEEEDRDSEGASQGIWLARVRPEDCENIIRYTVLQGKVVKPGHQLRGGFDREKGLISW